jgi:hypothetical protein
VSKSDNLRLRDVRAAFRLIGECRDLGNNPRLWHRRMLEGLVLLFGVVQASGGEAWWDRPGRPVQMVSAYLERRDGPGGSHGEHGCVGDRRGARNRPGITGKKLLLSGLSAE